MSHMIKVCLLAVR